MSDNQPAHTYFFRATRSPLGGLFAREREQIIIDGVVQSAFNTLGFGRGSEHVVNEGSSKAWTNTGDVSYQTFVKTQSTDYILSASDQTRHSDIFSR